MRVAVVGATGLVGREMLAVLAERDMPVTELIPVASERSIGTEMVFGKTPVRVVGVEQAISLRPEIALFSVGGEASQKFAPRFAKAGAVVIDNSSAWRMDPEVPLVVPEINAASINTETRIIANPNCSTIQLVMALAPLHEHFGLGRVVVSTYQSVSGTGKTALEQLHAEQNGEVVDNAAYPHPIHENCIPQCDVFLENGYTREEMKLVNESRKILGIPDLRLTATAVRVPVRGGHSEAVNIRFERPASVTAIQKILSNTAGVVVQDEPATSSYPMPKNAHGKDAVLVGRIREDESEENSFNMWIVADNLRKGAATNAVQILEWVLTMKGK